MKNAMISGSWIDIVHPNSRDGVYWNRQTISYSDADWQRLITHLRHDLGCDTLILTNVAVHDGQFLYPSKLPGARYWPMRGSNDPVKAILSAAETEQMSVFVGVGVYPGLAASGHVPSGDRQADSVRWSREVAEDLLALYGNHKSFRGFYTSSELFFSSKTGLLDDGQVAWVRAFSDALHALQPGFPILTSPFHCWQVAKVQPDAKALARCIVDTGVDIFAPQDGVGFDRPDSPRPVVNSEKGFRRIASALRETNVRLWGNVELFRFENDIMFQPLLPAPFERVRRQIEAIGPHVEKVCCYQMPGLMTSQKVCPELGALETEQLYQDYQCYIKETHNPK